MALLFIYVFFHSNNIENWIVSHSHWKEKRMTKKYTNLRQTHHPNGNFDSPKHSCQGGICHWHILCRCDF